MNLIWTQKYTDRTTKHLLKFETRLFSITEFDSLFFNKSIFCFSYITKFVKFVKDNLKMVRNVFKLCISYHINGLQKTNICLYCLIKNVHIKKKSLKEYQSPFWKKLVNRVEIIKKIEKQNIILQHINKYRYHICKIDKIC